MWWIKRSEDFLIMSGEVRLRSGPGRVDGVAEAIFADIADSCSNMGPWSIN